MSTLLKKMEKIIMADTTTEGKRNGYK